MVGCVLDSIQASIYGWYGLPPGGVVFKRTLFLSTWDKGRLNVATKAVLLYNLVIYEM